MVQHPGKLGQEFKAGTWSQGLKQRPRRDAVYRLPTPPHRPPSWFVLYNPEPPTQGWHRPRALSPPTPIIKKMPYSCAYAPMWWGQFLIEGPSSRVTPVCVKLTNNLCAVPPFSWKKRSSPLFLVTAAIFWMADDVILPSGHFKDPVSKQSHPKVLGVRTLGV